MVAVGAYEVDIEQNGQNYGNAGKIFLYKVNGDDVTLAQSVHAPSIPTMDFGHKLAISGNRLAVGGVFRGLNGISNPGAVYLYEIQNDGTVPSSTATIHSLSLTQEGRDHFPCP